MPTVLEEILMEEYEKGRSEGETEGYSRGQDEGRAEGRRALIGLALRTLQRRFGELPKIVVDHLNGMTDLVALESVNVEAIECESLEEFIKGL